MELLRTENILKRAIDVEAGLSEKPRVTEEHPDGCKRAFNNYSQNFCIEFYLSNLKFNLHVIIRDI